MTSTRFEATSTVPQPLAITGVVINDFPSRTLFVRRPDNFIGPGRIAWTRGYQALRRQEETGYRGDVPDLWASTKTADRVAHGKPADGFMLKFFFEPGNQAYGELIVKPRLTAIVTVDRSTGYFLGCKFLHV